jgi:hypothetical protein
MPELLDIDYLYHHTNRLIADDSSCRQHIE